MQRLFRKTLHISDGRRHRALFRKRELFPTQLIKEENTTITREFHKQILILSETISILFKDIQIITVGIEI